MGMRLKITLIAATEAVETDWKSRIEKALARQIQGVTVEAAHTGGEHGQLVFVDGEMPDLASRLAAIERKGRAIVLLVAEGAEAPEVFKSGAVDDLLVHPLRPLEVLSKLQHFRQILMWDEVSRLNAGVSESISRLKEDLKLAERLQKGNLPSRFADVKGAKVVSRYLAGMRSGGDYFDLADSRDGKILSLVLSDSSSYGLSSAVLSVLMRVAMKLSGDEVRSSYETVRRIQEELLLALGPKDRLSLFYGVISRQDWKLRYLNLGSSRAFYASPGGRFSELPYQGAPIATGSALPEETEGEKQLEPEGRLVLLSDGFIETVGGTDPARELLDHYRSGDAMDGLNEMVFRLKSKFQEEDDMPEQDCTAVALDVDSRVVRAKFGGGTPR
jgi:serine phosphatase RsbU (regulator of sigma subunit)